ncbi:MAG: glycosyltransferase family 2 protein [Candidatus Woesebacteria bacterium]|nr:glycosyltransferase family 2 protein [Candidatus Woesebacteria bacterium]
MYRGKLVSLILPAYNESESIKGVVNGFKKTGVVDEIVVVDNNSKDETAQIAKSLKGVTLINEKKQGYGFAIRRGLKEAKGDYLVLCDCDNTYKAEDIGKLLRYANKYDLVFSTRTNKKFILKGSNMYGLRRIANIFVGRLIQFLFHGSTHTDPGATFRLVNRKAYEVLKNKFTVGGVNFQPELTILALNYDFKIKEVPVYYGARTGLSKISGSFWGGIKTAVKMLKVIFEYKLN